MQIPCCSLQWTRSVCQVSCSVHRSETCPYRTNRLWICSAPADSRTSDSSLVSNSPRTCRRTTTHPSSRTTNWKVWRPTSEPISRKVSVVWMQKSPKEYQCRPRAACQLVARHRRPKAEWKPRVSNRKDRANPNRPNHVSSRLSLTNSAQFRCSKTIHSADNCLCCK